MHVFGESLSLSLSMRAPDRVILSAASILRRRVGYTIGAGGVHLKQVRAETQVTVHIEDSLIDDYSVAFFFGVESDLRQRAVEMVGSRALRSPDRVEDNLVALE